MSDTPSPAVLDTVRFPPETPHISLLGGHENMKLLYDTTMALLMQSVADNQANARSYAALNLRRAENAATIDHLGSLNAVISAQAGDTSDQQTTDPIRTGAADALAAAAYTPNRTVDTASAGISAADLESVQTNVTTQISALTEQITALAGGVTTALQALADSNALIASALSALAPAAKVA